MAAGQEVQKATGLLEISSTLPGVSHSINRCVLQRNGSMSTQKVALPTLVMNPGAAAQSYHDPLEFLSYCTPSKKGRGKTIKKLENFRKLECDPLGNFSESTMTSLLSETQNGMPPRPRRIILIRHGQSEGNIDESAYTRIPDSKIALTEEGWNQAVQCGRKIRRLIETDEDKDWQVYFYVSPYLRTVLTLRGIGLAFEQARIAGVREEPRLREQDFGNFQDRERMRLEKAVRIRYGRFFYRFPNGESAADVYDRITGFRETLRADIDVGRFQQPEARLKNMNLIIVSHGLTLRVFLMRWYKWTVQQFEALHNFANTGMLVMELGPGGRYSLAMHHTPDELRAFGMTDDMIADQEWQKIARPGELNHNWCTSGPSFFHHFDAAEKGLDLDEIPADVFRGVVENGAAVQPEPPIVWPV